MSSSPSPSPSPSTPLSEGNSNNDGIAGNANTLSSPSPSDATQAQAPSTGQNPPPPSLRFANNNNNARADNEAAASSVPQHQHQSANSSNIVDRGSTIPASTTSVTRLRYGWSSSPKVPQHQSYVPPLSGEGILGETAVQKQVRKEKLAAQKGRDEEEARKLTEEEEVARNRVLEQAEKDEAERVAKNRLLDEEIEQKTLELERMRMEHARELEEQRLAVAALSAAPVVPAVDSLEKAEEGKAHELPGGTASPDKEILDESEKKVEEEGDDSPTIIQHNEPAEQPEGQSVKPIPSQDPEEQQQSNKKRRCMMLLLLLLLGIGGTIVGVLFDRSSEEQVPAVVPIGDIPPFGDNETLDAPSGVPSMIPSTPSSAIDNRPSLRPVMGNPAKLPTSKPVTGNPTKQLTEWPLPDGATRQPSTRPTTISPTNQPNTMPVTISPTMRPTASALLFIEGANMSLLNEGGIPDTDYSFNLTAEQIPAGIGEVRFEWTPGFGAGGSAIATVVDGEAATTIELSYPTPGSYEISSSVYNGARELAVESLQVRIAGTTLTIDPAGLTDALLSVPYTFNFVAADIPSTVSIVEFTWSFGTGQFGAGNSGSIPTANGGASATASHIYDSTGAYGLVADVRDASTNAVLAQSSVTVTVGQTNLRTATLDSCGDWNAARSGGEGVTVDNWDISATPAGAVFDVKYHMYVVPDQMMVHYPISNAVLESGWRGDSSKHGQSPLYPGGIKGDGDSDEFNLFTKLTEDIFQVTVIGPDPETGWDYDVRCRTPSLKDNEACAVDTSDNCLSATCAYASFSSKSSSVCCESSTSSEVYTRTVGGWPSNSIRYFCNEQPDGTLCGETDTICSSNACVWNTCRSSKLAANEVCAIGNDCDLDTCAYESFSPTPSSVCCSSGNSMRICSSASNGWAVDGCRYFCIDQPIGTLCGENDGLCKSNACVGGTCQGSKLTTNESCSVNNDCILGACGYQSYSSSSSTVCCSSGARTRIFVSSSEGWPSSASRYFCTDQPNGTLCGESDEICESNACVGGKCQSSKLSANSLCSVGNDCALDACGHASFSPNLPTVCCSSGDTTSSYVPSSNGFLSGAPRSVCTDQPEGTLCGERDEICASSACVGGVCESSKLAANTFCSVSNDCILGSCGYRSFSPDASKICCPSGASTRVYVTRSEGWPSTGPQSFCADQPEGTLCGESDGICQSDSCIAQTCAGSNLPKL